ncbi:unnamed protein product [Tetraodon nigroviridis]|uniref:(spotted green pufferfish) hypothetical protein n=1 Tax=Tetraodon nigroviridis TaxID=99883 RepID=Q4SVJ8_TETNG|nr:unnamed protein product [Tetraodon nigroviridis]
MLQARRAVPTDLQPRFDGAVSQDLLPQPWHHSSRRQVAVFRVQAVILGGGNQAHQHEIGRHILRVVHHLFLGVAKQELSGGLLLTSLTAEICSLQERKGHAAARSTAERSEGPQQRSADTRPPALRAAAPHPSVKRRGQERGSPPAAVGPRARTCALVGAESAQPPAPPARPHPLLPRPTAPLTGATN